MSRILGSAFSILFGIFWTVMVAGSGAPAFMPLFGLLFVLIGILNLIRAVRGAAEPSAPPLTKPGGPDEADPYTVYFGNRPPRGRFCPYCGLAAEADHNYCKECGGKL